MNTVNPPARSLFRSLGADDSYFENKARAASKEAEQRWPLFKAVAPAKSEDTPELSAQEKDVSWNVPPVAAEAPVKQRLTRPGLSHKLATGLQELSQKTREENAAVAPPARSRRTSAASAPAVPLAQPSTLLSPLVADAAPETRGSHAKGELESSLSRRAPTAASTTAVPLAAEPPAVSTTVSPAPVGRSSAKSRANASTVPTAEAASGSASSAKGLFGKLSKANASAVSVKDAPAAPAADPTLRGLFNRLRNAQAPAAEPVPKSGGLFARVGR